MWRTLYSGHLSIADSIRTQFTLPPLTDLFITNPPSNRSYNMFLASKYNFDVSGQKLLYSLFRVVFYSFYEEFFDRCYFIFSHFNALFRSINLAVFTSMVDTLPSCKDVQCATEQGQEHGYNPGDFCGTCPINPSLL